MERFISIFLVLFFAQGLLAKGLGPIQIPSHDELLERYDQVAEHVEFEVRVVTVRSEKNFKYIQKELSYISPDTNNIRALTLDFYIPHEAEHRALPTILLYPSLRGLTKFDIGYAKTLAKKGFVAVINHVIDDVADLNTVQEVGQAFYHGVRDSLLIVDHLTQLEIVRNDQIGTLGVSLGGIRAALFHGIDPQIKATAIVCGAGNVPNIITYSDEYRVTAMRGRMLEQLGTDSLITLEQELRKHLLYDPVFFSNFWEGERPLYVVTGSKDKKVPYGNQQEFLSHNTSAQVKNFPLGHNAAIASSFIDKRPVISFFRNELNR